MRPYQIPSQNESIHYHEETIHSQDQNYTILSLRMNSDSC